MTFFDVYKENLETISYIDRLDRFNETRSHKSTSDKAHCQFVIATLVVLRSIAHYIVYLYDIITCCSPLDCKLCPYMYIAGGVHLSAAARIIESYLDIVVFIVLYTWYVGYISWPIACVSYLLHEVSIRRFTNTANTHPPLRVRAAVQKGDAMVVGSMDEDYGCERPAYIRNCLLYFTMYLMSDWNVMCL